MKILIVDDYDDMREWIKISLAETYQVFDASNAKDALDFIQNNKVDLILTDFNMPPGISGLALIKEVKSTMPYIKTVLMSMQDIGDDEYLKENGVDLFLSKHLPHNEFCNLLDKFIRS